MNYDTVFKFAIHDLRRAVIVVVIAIVMVVTDDTEDRYRLYIHMDVDAI